MKRTFLLLASSLLAISMAVAQDTPSDTAANSAQRPSLPAAGPSNAQAVIRGCLSGSSGNYTLTDRNGMQYQVTGDDAALRSVVGREVEITGLENSASEASSHGEETTNHVTNGVQVSEVRAVASSCNHGVSGAAPPP